jgi:subtilisin family serine protease
LTFFNAGIRRDGIAGKCLFSFRSGWLVFALLGTFIFAGGGWLEAQTSAVVPRRGRGLPNSIRSPKYAPDRVLVRFRSRTSKSVTQSLHAAFGANLLRAYSVVNNLQLVSLPAGVSVKEAITAYRRNPDVIYAEPDYAVHATELPDDPRFPELWGLHNTGQNGGTVGADIHAPAAWGSITTGSSANVVAVIDSGIDYNHVDLADNMWRSPDGFTVTLGSNVVTCPAGTHGVNAVTNTCDPMDDNIYSHGTHVSGTIGAVGNNSVGVTGVNWSIQLMACKFLDSGGSGYLSGVLACLDFVKARKDAGVNILATNNSWGGGQFSQPLQDAIQTQQQRGILFIAAAENISNDNDVSPTYPSSFYLPGLISVANTTRYDALASTSNFGKHSVHLGAPGTEILSTLRGNTYGLLNGTSMATPHVTGVAALLKAQDPSRDWKAIKNLLLAGGDNLSALATKTVTGKRLNAYGSLTCSNSVVLSRLRPISDLIATSVSGPIDLAALHINCDSPNGSVQIPVDPGGDAVTLVDDGANPDQVAGDGIYSGRWTPSATGVYTLGFPGSDNVVAQVLSGYTYTLSPPGSFYRDITGTNLHLDDESVERITSPFPIHFGGGGFNNLYISSNGTISFVENFLSSTNYPIPTSRTSTLVAPFWDDLDPIAGTDQNVFWEVLGTAPNRELVVEWRNVRHFSCHSDSSATVKFQVVFPEGSSRIYFNYADTTFGGGCTSSDYGATATVGVQIGSQSGTQFSYMTASLADNTSIRWSRPASATLSTTSLDFGDQRVGITSAAHNVVLSNNGGESLHLTQVDVSTNFAQQNNCGSEITEGNSCTFEVTFTPTTTGSRTGTLTLTDNAAGNPHVINLAGNGVAPAVTLSLTSLSFSNQLVGTTSAAQLLTLTNSGTGPLTINSIGITGTNSGDFPQTNTCPVPPATLAVDAGCPINVTFRPTAPGSRSGTITITDNAPGSPQVVSLTGIGIGPVVTLLPSSLAFGSRLVGSASASQTITLSNDGDASLNITSIAASAGGDFVIETNTCGTALAAGANCPISVTFHPSAAGTRNGTITITDNAPGNPHTVGLSGTGMDFAIGVPIGSSSSVTITAGGTANYTVAITPQGGFNQSVTLSCSRAPSASTCSVSPSSITPDGTNPASVTVTVTTTARSGALPRSGLPSIPPGFGKLVTVSWFLWLLGLLLLGRWTLSSQRRRWLGLAATVLFVTLWAACGGGGGGGSPPPPRPPGTPAGTCTLTVTATSGSLSHSTSLTLTVT